ncbi:glycoside hydrolase family 16 protein [Micromonospora echinofusca]|uniref:Family 16 glycosylhydrolase n=1 Tax=Micromonospora echinofusca TaxID=47858 RepID=A0ABS3VY94_MICEH|nr:glycoside hydrolase family 16 protein [Micromonospora echinofusca]MBO4209441.1 family 16 glycosylhydrolase [Micromonospora echinofusca]
MRLPASTRRRHLVLLTAGLLGLTVAGCGTAPQSTVATGVPSAAPESTSVALPGQLTWSDEFDGPAGSPPDPDRWGYDRGGQWNREELQYYTDSPENVALDGQGNLVITALRDDSGSRVCRDGPCRFTSARLSTAGRFSQLYGTFEARIKLPVEAGLLPAFWMLGDDIRTAGWPDCGEIDVVEHPGEAVDTVHGGVHAPGHSGGATFSLPQGRSFADDFHTFTVRWTPEAINFFVDGVWYGRRTPEHTGPAGWVFDQPFFLVLNLAVGGEWAGRPADRTRFPQRMIVDYVRVHSWDTKPQ